eukprot:10723070-Lingulodinium_polyedra.AAC.1
MPLDIPEAAVRAARPEVVQTANEESQWRGQAFPGEELFGEGAEITAARAVRARVRVPAEAASRAARAGVGGA